MENMHITLELETFYNNNYANKNINFTETISEVVEEMKVFILENNKSSTG